MDDWGPQFKALLESPLGQELKRTLKEDLHDHIIKSAQTAENMENSYALLKEAGGVIKALEHLEFRTVTPRDEGGKVKNKN